MIQGFLETFDAMPNGGYGGTYQGRRYRITKTQMSGGRSQKLEAEELGGNDYWETGTARPDLVLADLVREHFDLRPKGLIEMLDLKRPIYRDTAAYGHFGRTEEAFSWERTDMADTLRDAAGLQPKENVV